LLSFTYKNPDQKKTSNKQLDIDQKIITKFYQLRQSYEMHASTLKYLLRKRRKQRWTVWYHTTKIILNHNIVNLCCSLKLNICRSYIFIYHGGQPTIPITADTRLTCSWRHVASSRWLLICDKLRALAAGVSCNCMATIQKRSFKKPRLEEGHSKIYSTLSDSTLPHP
jgi:hypothetical protein